MKKVRCPVQKTSKNNAKGDPSSWAFAAVPPLDGALSAEATTIATIAAMLSGRIEIREAVRDHLDAHVYDRAFESCLNRARWLVRRAATNLAAIHLYQLFQPWEEYNIQDIADTFKKYEINKLTSHVSTKNLLRKVEAALIEEITRLKAAVPNSKSVKEADADDRDRLHFSAAEVILQKCIRLDVRPQSLKENKQQPSAPSSSPQTDNQGTPGPLPEIKLIAKIEATSVDDRQEVIKILAHDLFLLAARLCVMDDDLRVVVSTPLPMQSAFYDEQGQFLRTEERLRDEDPYFPQQWMGKGFSPR